MPPAGYDPAVAFGCERESRERCGTRASLADSQVLPHAARIQHGHPLRSLAHEWRKYMADPTARTQLQQHLHAPLAPQLIYLAVKLGIADHLRDGARSSA